MDPNSNLNGTTTQVEIDEDDGYAPAREWRSDEERASGVKEAASSAETLPETPFDEEPAPEDAPPPPAAAQGEQLGWDKVAEESAKVDEAKRVKAPRVRKVVVAGAEHVLQKDERRGVELVDVSLTDAERVALSLEMVRVSDEKASIEEALKTHGKVERGRIAEKAQEIARLAFAIKTGKEAREVDVLVRRDDRVGDLVTVEVATGKELSRRPQTWQERQLGIPEVDPAMELVVAEEAAKPKKRGRKKKDSAAGAEA